MSWVSPPLTASGSGSKSNAGSGQPPLLGSQALSVPTTPPNVRDVRPSTCLALSDFKGKFAPPSSGPLCAVLTCVSAALLDMLRQYRSLDDSINTRLNRALARSREAGEGPAPSLLSSRTTASSLATDLGTSTYATTPRQACAQMWSELAAVWAGREDVIRYCIAITDPTAPAAAATGADARLDADAIPPTPAYGRGEDSRHVLVCPRLPSHW